MRRSYLGPVQSSVLERCGVSPNGHTTRYLAATTVYFHHALTATLVFAIGEVKHPLEPWIWSVGYRYILVIAYR